jgi:hypothetical protein
MSVKERRRLEIFGRVERGEMMLAEAAELLKLSYRQARRIRLRYKALGDSGLVHRLRGRVSNQKTDEAVRLQVLQLYRQKYADFGATLACEYLQEKDEIIVGRATLRRWLIAEGLLTITRRRSKHRTRRERRSHLGELVQMDGSWHDWFEGRGGGWCCSMVMVDDATGRVFARFYEKETQGQFYWTKTGDSSTERRQACRTGSRWAHAGRRRPRSRGTGASPVFAAVLLHPRHLSPSPVAASLTTNATRARTSFAKMSGGSDGTANQQEEPHDEVHQVCRQPCRQPAADGGSLRSAGERQRCRQ